MDVLIDDNEIARATLAAALTDPDRHNKASGKSCMICGNGERELILDLGEQPWGNDFIPPEKVGTEKKYPLRLVRCPQCTCVQLDTVVPKETMFSEHTYLSGTTKSLKDHFDLVAAEAVNLVSPDGNLVRVLDIGSNDGTQLQSYKKLGCSVLGIEPAKLPCEIAVAAGIPTRREFYDFNLAYTIGARRADIINASGVFYHLECLHSVAEGVFYNLADDGVFVIQFTPTSAILEGNWFDLIYHEHLLYYSLKTLEQLLNMHDLELVDAHQADVHGWTVAYAKKIRRDANPNFRKDWDAKLMRHKKSERLLAMMAKEESDGVNTKERWMKFAKDVADLKEKELVYLHAAKAAGKRVHGMGAPVKGNTLLNYFGVRSDLIEYLVERNPARVGLVAPGSHIPVVLEGQKGIFVPSIYYVLAWNFEKEILERNKSLVAAGVEFHFPLRLKRESSLK